nr:RHS repeat domain-containing protein [uncultured Allomuricauda sp.]
MKFKHLITVTLTVLSTSILAQEKSYFSELVPPSPDVAQLGQYGATQVGKYTGTANVSVPLHSISLDGLQIPIALSYQTGGIKVAQEASWVGLGWNLSANAIITRQVNGYDDLSIGAGAIGYLFSPSYSFGNLTSAQETALFTAYQNNVPHDTQPDLFTANLFGESIQFRIPKQGASNIIEAVVLNNKVVKVYYYVAEQYFKVVNGQGYEYNFGSAILPANASKEFTTAYRSDGSAGTDSEALAGSIAYQTVDNLRTWQKNTAWHVDNVIAPSGRTINFTYNKVSYFGYPSYSDSRNFVMCPGVPGSNGMGYQDYDGDTSREVSCTITGFQAVQLNQISGDFGTVDFTLSNREDISSRYQTNGNNFPSIITSGNPIQRLTGIIVKNNLSQTIKTVSFNQSYFNSDQSTDTGSYKKEKYMRLKLDGATVNDQTYTFDYIQPNDLPAKDSKDEDFWGFYNGKSNTSRIPSFGRLTLCHSNQKDIFLNLKGANRGADFNYGKIGLLNKVTYPTKGYTEFEYEGNSALVDKPTSAGYSNINTNSADLSYNYQYIKRTLTDGYQTSLGHNDTFEITSANSLPFAYNVKVDYTISCAGQCNGAVGNQNVIQIVKVSSPGAGTVVDSIPYVSTPQGVTLVNDKDFSLPNGTYRFEKPFFVSPSSGGAFLSSSIDAYYLDDPADSPFPWEEFEIGGARIKTATNRDIDGTFINKKQYTYDASNYGQIVSTGKLMNQLVYHSKYGFLDYTPQSFLEVFTMSSGSSVSLDFSANGSHIGYSYVSEMDVSEAGVAKGNILTAFENRSNELVNYFVGVAPLTNGPYSGDETSLQNLDVHYGNAYLIGVPPRSFSHRNGNVLWEEVEDSAFNTLKRVDNTYEDYQLDTIPVYKVYFSSAGKVADHGYGQAGRKFLPTVVETKDHFGSDIVTTMVTNTYETQKYLPRSTATTTSENGVERKQETFYIFDTAHGISSDPYISNLRSLNRMTEPVLIRSYENSELLSETRFKYGSFSGDYWRTEALEAKDGDSLTQRMDFVSYDDLGNLTEYKQTDGVPISYIWGYDQIYPVAKIQNATRAQIEALTHFNSNFHSGSGGLNTNQENSLRNGLPNAMVTTFLYKPGVGVTSTIDPRGYKTTYEYDTNNRLIKVKDANNDVVTDYDYHYKGQN